jgi:hypothetical protein
MGNLKQDHAAPAPDNLFAGDFPVVTGSGTIASGQGVLARGTVLGKVTAGGKLAIVDSTKSTGEQVVYAVLAEAVDATSADVDAPLYLTGTYNSRALVFGGTDTAATHTAGARALSIFIKDTVAAV